MRKRSEAKQGWTVQLYRYRVYLKGGFRFFDLPGAVQQEAQAMRDFWNGLVAKARTSSEHYQEILAVSPIVSAMQLKEQEVKTQVDGLWDAIKAARQHKRSLKSEEEATLRDRLTEAKQRLAQVREELKSAKAEAREFYKDKLAAHREVWDAYLREQRKTTAFHWGNREYLLDTFKAALGRARKEGNELKEKQGRFTTLHFRQPYTAGLPVGALLTHQGRVRFTAESPHRLTGQFLAGSVPLAFDCVYHRPLPERGFIKYFDLVGEEYAKGGGMIRDTQYQHRKPLWEWNLVIAIEFPPLPTLTRSTNKIAGIDIGWRQRPDGQLRVGYLLEAQGHERELCLPAILMTNFMRTIDLQKQTDTITEEIAEQLRKSEAAHFSEDIRQLLSYRHMTRPKMFALLRACEAYPDERALCEQWASATTKLYWQQRNLLRYCCNYRNDLYRKLALQLCREYRTIILEDLDLRTLRTKASKEGNPGLVLTEYLGRFANLSFFRRALIEAAVKTATEIKKIPARNTTVSCNECGEIVENTGSLWLSCSHGHRWDQDANAGKNLLTAFHAPL